jgi:hypothetical protein
MTRVSSFKIVSGDAVYKPTWPLLLKIEHMVSLFFVNIISIREGIMFQIFKVYHMKHSIKMGGISVGKLIRLSHVGSY